MAYILGHCVARDMPSDCHSVSSDHSLVSVAVPGARHLIGLTATRRQRKRRRLAVLNKNVLNKKEGTSTTSAGCDI